MSAATGIAAAASFAPTAPARESESPGTWLVSPAWDLSVFGGSALASMLLLAWGAATGALSSSVPPWLWVATVLAVDVAHVWATVYRVYLDPLERCRRPGLYLGIPLASYVGGVLLYSHSGGLFWRVLAYLAVFHFIRQQYGWVALYRRRLPPAARLDRVLDDAAIYASTLYPVLHWHASLPREFEWFIAGDFIPGLPAEAAQAAFPVYAGILAAYALRQVQLAARGKPVSAGKNVVVATTALTWGVGIVWLDSDYAFTVTNVLVHGIPYLALVWLYGSRRFRGGKAALAPLFERWRWPLFLLPLLAFAFLEEWGWDRLVWHERGALFPGADLFVGSDSLALIVPLLALPQATHYLLDAWIWRGRGNPGLSENLGF